MKNGIKGVMERQVTPEQTARAMGSGELEVLATPALLALAEETAWRSLAGELEPGQGTVGTRVELSHLAATAVGRTVRCETELLEVDRRRLVFSFRVLDDAGLAAEGTHERFIVENQRFLEKAEAR